MSFNRWCGSDVEQRARDILESLEAIRAFIMGMDRTAFINDRKTRSAVEFELLRISEAAAKIRDMQGESSIPQRARIATQYAKWSAICAIGNRLRHEYGRVDDEIIWQTVAANDLRHLEATIRQYFSLSSA
jgi:uncharacterized protein with HEPN domain